MGDVQSLKLMGMTVFRMAHPSNRMTPFKDLLKAPENRGS